MGFASVAAITLHNTILSSAVSLHNTFISTISPELQTPLTPILGYSDPLLDKDTPESIRRQCL